MFLMMIVTIKNEEAVEMVLKSTCESSCFLVTKINWCFYFLQSEIVSTVKELSTGVVASGSPG